MAASTSAPARLDDMPEVLTALDLVRLGFGSRNAIYESVRAGGVLAGASFRLGHKICFSKRAIQQILDRIS